ncbi:MAG: pantoate--beta-alanine ligase [Ferruginibacter sp.]
MIFVKKISKLQEILSAFKQNGNRIGFVPTMGALHEGHVSLIRRSKEENDISICSIFVNPAQFNNPADLKLYPQTPESDLDQCEKAGCDILFLPSVTEMYPPGEAPVHYELGYLETILEGKYRPGHFQGVCMIVDKLLAATTPDTMYLGRKDFQQCLVIKKMAELQKYATSIRICDTIREKDGLAMSSRNRRLNAAERETAVKISACLLMMKEKFGHTGLQEIKRTAGIFLENNGYTVDYAEIADAETLEILKEQGSGKAVALVAAYLNGVRLIDNMLL